MNERIIRIMVVRGRLIVAREHIGRLAVRVLIVVGRIAGEGLVAHLQLDGFVEGY